MNNLYGWPMPQRFPVNEFKWVDDISKFNKDFIKSFNDESDEGYFLEVGVQYPEKLPYLRNDLSVLSERVNIGKSWKDYW